MTGEWLGWWQHNDEERIIKVVEQPNQRGEDTLVRVATLAEAGRLINARYMRVDTLTTYYHRIEDPTMSINNGDSYFSGEPDQDAAADVVETSPVGDDYNDALNEPGWDVVADGIDRNTLDNATGDVLNEAPIEGDNGEPSEPETPVQVSPKEAIMEAAKEFGNAMYDLGVAGDRGQDFAALDGFESKLDGVLTNGPLTAGWYTTDRPDLMLLRDANRQWWMITDTAAMMATDWTYIQTILGGGSVRLLKALVAS